MVSIIKLLVSYDNTFSCIVVSNGFFPENNLPAMRFQRFIFAGDGVSV